MVSTKDNETFNLFENNGATSVKQISNLWVMINIRMAFKMCKSVLHLDQWLGCGNASI